MVQDFEGGFFEYLQREERATWTLLKIVGKDGLVIINPETDAVTATNRLLLTYPGLHEILTTLINQWAEEQQNVSDAFRSLISSEGGK